MKKITLFSVLFLCMFLVSEGAFAVRGYVGNFVNKGVSGWDVTGYGALGDASTDDSAAFTATIAAAADSRVIIPTGTYKLSSNVTIPSGVTMFFHQGGLLSIDAGVTVTFNGKLEAGLSQIFSGSGTAAFAKGSTAEVIPHWWGAVGNDSTDCTAAFISAVVAANNVGRLFVPSGTYKITSPIYGWPMNTVSSMDSGFIFEGQGTETTLKYYGTTGYCIEMRPIDLLDAGSVVGATIRDLHIEAPNITSADDGGCILSTGAYNSISRITFDNAGTATGIHCRRRHIPQSVDSMTNDTDRDFTSSGVGASEKYAIKFTTQSIAVKLKFVTVRLGATGAGGAAPAGTIRAELWTDVAGSPGAIVARSAYIDCDTLSTDADGADQQFTFSLPAISTSTDYWIVLETEGYTYADGVTEVRLRVDAGDGAVDGFATYNFGVAWGTSDDGSNYEVIIGAGQSIQTMISECSFYGSPRIARAIWASDSSRVFLSDLFLAAVEGIFNETSSSILGTRVKFLCSESSGYLMRMVSGESYFSDSYMEGGLNGALYTAGVHRLVNCHISGTQLDVSPKVNFRQIGCGKDYMRSTDNPGLLPDSWMYRLIPPSGIWETSLDPTVETDADALFGEAWEMDTHNQIVRSICRRSLNYSTEIQGEMPRGTWKVTLWMKDSNQLANDCLVRGAHSTLGVFSIQWQHLFTLTGEYRPYTFFIVIDETISAIRKHGTRIGVRKDAEGANTISVSHVIWEYVGPDGVSTKDLVAWSSDGSDADESRKSSVYFYGSRTATGVKLPLAQIEASHNGAGGDHQGQLRIKINDGNDTINTLNTELTVDEDGVVVAGDLTISGDDLKMATNTDTFILVADGTEYSPVEMTGDVTITNAGVTAVGDDSHAHTGSTLSGAAAFDTLDTGQGANELYDMDQNVQQSDSPTFAGLLVTDGAGNTVTLATASPPALAGTARPTRYIELDVIRFTPEGDTSANAGTVTRRWDLTNFRSYYRWTSGSATQDMDYYIEFIIPDDFSAWAASNSFNMDVRTNDKDANTLTVTMYINANTIDAGISAVDVLPSANDTWETKQDQPTGAYVAGQRAKLKIRVANDAASDTIDIARIWLSYLASN